MFSIKQLPLWFKGGIIGLIPLMVVGLLSLINSSIPYVESGPFQLLEIVYFLFFTMTQFLFIGIPCSIMYFYIPGGKELCINQEELTLLEIIFFIGVYFVIGAFFGYLIHKTQR